MSRRQSAVGRQILGSLVKERLKFVEEIPPNSQFQLCGSGRKLKLLFYPFFYSASYSVLPEAMNLAASRYFFSMHECAEDIDASPAPRMKHYQLVFLFLLFISTRRFSSQSAGLCFTSPQHFQEPAYQGLEELSGAESRSGGDLGCPAVLRQASGERAALKSSGFFSASRGRRS